MTHLVDEFYSRLEHVDYVETFKSLKLKYDQARVPSDALQLVTEVLGSRKSSCSHRKLCHQSPMPPNPSGGLGPQCAYQRLLRRISSRTKAPTVLISNAAAQGHRLLRALLDAPPPTRRTAAQSQERGGPSGPSSDVNRAREALSAARHRRDARALPKDEEDYFNEVRCASFIDRLPVGNINELLSALGVGPVPDPHTSQLCYVS